MPWKASSVMEERLGFAARLLNGEATTEVCRAGQDNQSAVKNPEAIDWQWELLEFR
jgi:hypothetical protein